MYRSVLGILKKRKPLWVPAAFVPHPLIWLLLGGPVAGGTVESRTKRRKEEKIGRAGFSRHQENGSADGRC